MGWLARQAERAVLQRWRACGWPPAVIDSASMPQGGISETVAMIGDRDKHLLWSHVLLAVTKPG